MDNEEINKLLDLLLDAPEGQIDELALEQIRNIKNSKEKVRSTLTRKLIEDCSYYSLTSDFTINIIGIVHNALIDIESNDYE